MASAVVSNLGHSIHENEHRSIIVSSSWSTYLALVLALQFVTFDLAMCKAFEPPTVAELRRDHSEIRANSRNVQGKIRVFRSETVNPAALEELPSDIGITLIRIGDVWRSEKRFRVDFISYRPNSEVVKESQHSVALDKGKVYEFTSGVDLDGGMLRVYDKGTSEAADAMKSIESKFLQPLDSLWSCSGNAIVDMLQRPGTDIVPNKSPMLPGGYTLLVSQDDGNKAQFELEPAKNHPFGYLLTSAGEGDMLVTVKRRVFSIEKEGTLFPTRVVEVMSLGPDSGYTEVMMLDLKPLEANSPIASEITSASFQNFGSGYQVYNFRASEKEELAERYERPATFSPSSGNNFSTYFLWVNGFVVFTLLAYIIYRHRNKKKM